MPAHGEKLSRKQETVIAALLTAPTVTAAAKQAGINEFTVYRWLKTPGFQAAYMQARRAVVQHAVTRLQQITTTAVATLHDIMLDVASPSSARVSAAKAVLDMAIKAVELEQIEERLTALEAAIGGHHGS